MYLYEDMDLDELLDDPEIDPDSADALFAIAQCYRFGKGTDEDEALYRANLNAAAQAGSEDARRELERELSARQAPEEDGRLEELPLYQLRRLAEEDDPAAILRMAYNSISLNDPEATRAYLLRAEKHIGQAVYTQEQEQDIFLKLGELFARAPFEDPKQSMHYFGLASELGSARAALVLSGYASSGYGCPADPVQADAWMRRAAESGDVNVKYELAMKLLDTKPVLACSLLDEVAHSAEDEGLCRRARIFLASRKNGKIPDDMLDDAWSIREEPAVAAFLEQSYNAPETEPVFAPAGMTAHPLRAGDDGFTLLVAEGATDRGLVNGLPITQERAEWLSFRAEQNARRRLWMLCARALGSGTASAWIEADDLCEEALRVFDQDPGRADSLFRRAAELGSPRAAYRLGMALQFGQGVARDAEAAAHWLLVSAREGYVDAMYAYAEYCMEGTLDSSAEKRGWMERAARNDHTEALFALCGSQKPGDAPQRLTALAENGHCRAQYLLALCHGNGLGVSRDSALSAKWFREAARTRPEGEYDLKRNDIVDYAFAAASIADNMLMNEQRDPDQTFYWAKEAYEAHQAGIPRMAGRASICFASILGNCYAYGIGTPVDHDRALACYRSADERYEYAAPAWAGMGRCFLFGDGVQKDLAQARAFLEKAQQAGFQSAPAVLEQLAAEENAQQQQRDEEKRQEALEADFSRCGRYLLALLILIVLAEVFTVVHVPFVGDTLRGALSLGVLVMIVTGGVSCYTLYQKSAGRDFGGRLGRAFLAECAAFAQALAGLFRSGGSGR